VVGSATALAVASCATSGPGVARGKKTPLQATKLNERFVLITGAGGNVLAVTGPEGLLLVDGGLPERSAELLKLAYAETGAQRVSMLFNTHWHWDHTGSNETLGKAGAKILAHENTKLWLGGDFFSEWENRAYKPRPAHALPNQTFYTSGKVSFANEEVVYGYLPRAHTDGDIYVFFPAANVLVTGGLLSVGSFPIPDYTTGGWIVGMLDANKALLEVCDAQTRIIPASGPVQTKADLQAQHDMLATVKDRLVGLMRKGMGAEDMLASGATREFEAKWGDPTLFVSNAYKGMWGHVRELGGIV
jgi:cyclase